MHVMCPSPDRECPAITLQGYSDTTVCQLCANMATGFLPLIVAILVVSVIVALFCKEAKAATTGSFTPRTAKVQPSGAGET